MKKSENKQKISKMSRTTTNCKEKRKKKIFKKGHEISTVCCCGSLLAAVGASSRPGGKTSTDPSTKTIPAELVVAALILTSHVLAAAVLLDGCLTLWALFGVTLLPSGARLIIGQLGAPLLTSNGCVRLVTALEAKLKAARAAYIECLRHCHRADLNDVSAAGWIGAPAHQTVGSHIALGDNLLVLLLSALVLDQIQDSTHAGRVVTGRLHALDAFTESLAIDLLLEILAPTASTIQMVALQAGHLFNRAGDEADLADDTAQVFRGASNHLR